MIYIYILIIMYNTNYYDLAVKCKATNHRHTKIMVETWPAHGCNL